MDEIFLRKQSLKDLNIDGKRVLMRVDFNVPFNRDGSIRDHTRILLTLPSIQYVLNRGGRVILMSHLGRPKEPFDPNFSLKPCAQELSKLLGKKVQFVSHCIGNEVQEKAKNLKPGELLLLENLRFYEGEEFPEKDLSFAKSLAELGEVYINDAFGAAHRSHASTTEVTRYFGKNCGMGFLMEREVLSLSKILLNPDRSFYAIIGGAKIGNKIDLLLSFSRKVDGLFIGGGMAFTFFKAKGISIGDSICDESRLNFASNFLKECDERKIKIYLPIDVVITNGTKVQTVQINNGIPKGWKGQDIGFETVELWSKELSNSGAVFWNGPMGVFEECGFAFGTEGLAKHLSEISGEVTIGGGDLVGAIHSLNLDKKFYHISSGGGASLEFLANGTLPGLEAIVNK